MAGEGGVAAFAGRGRRGGAVVVGGVVLVVGEVLVLVVEVVGVAVLAGEELQGQPVRAKVLHLPDSLRRGRHLQQDF